VLSALLIPVFIVMTALVVDVGQWYTHKRQLQNRADAAAFAAGIEYAKNWKACVQTADPALRTSTAREIANVARQFAGNPEAADYAPDPLPATIYNANIATQSKLDVVVNSWNYTDDNDYSDDEPGVAASPSDVTPGDPCFLHTGDAISPGGGQWTDVRVKENDLPSLFGTIGLPLKRNVARARIEIRPALSGHKFLPIAVPNNVITRVQVRYYDNCRDPNHTSPLAIKDLAPLPNGDQTAFASMGGGVLWGLPAVDGDLSVGNASRPFDLNIPAFDPADCNTEYLPVSTEVRIASRPEVNLNQSCSDLLTNNKFADCFGNLSLIRVWDDGNPASHPLIKEVTLTGGCATRADGYFGPYTGGQPAGARTCNYGATVNVDFGNRYPGGTNFNVQVNGVNLVPPGTNPNGVWTTNGTPLVATTDKQGSQPETGANEVRVKVFWRPASGGPQSYPTGGGNGELVQQSYVGTQDTAGAVDLVRNSGTGFSLGLPSGPLANVTDGGVQRSIVPTIGIRSVLRSGIFTTLRTEDSQGSQLVACDPSVSPGKEFLLFKFGCQPWFAANAFVNGPWWNTTTRECPDWGLWYSTTPKPAPYGANSETNPWRCVLQAPGSSNGQTGDWMIVATSNCKDPVQDTNTNKCHNWKTALEANCGNYDGKPGDPNGWLQKGGDSNDPRVVDLFIVPYQALKGVSGSKAEIPLLGFASFYVMGWRGQNASENDPCPDPDFGGVPYSTPDKGTVQGVFVETVNYEPGPVDANATCVEGLLTPCRVTLVR
jgi:hypothetical protein